MTGSKISSCTIFVISAQLMKIVSLIHSLFFPEVFDPFELLSTVT